MSHTHTTHHTNTNLHHTHHHNTSNTNNDDTTTTISTTTAAAAAVQPPPPPQQQQQQYLQNKAQMILSLLDEPMIDLWSIRAHAITNGGLVNDTIRKKVWPKLVGLHERIWDGQDLHHSHHDPTTTSQSPSQPQPQYHRSMEESMVVTPKRSNVVSSFVSSSSSSSSGVTPTTTTERPNSHGDGHVAATTIDPTKKMQDIFRSEVSHSNSTTNKNKNSNTLRSFKKRNDPDDNTKDDTHSISSSGSYSSGASSALTMRHRNHHHHHHTVLASSIDATQIELDVLRCTWHLLTKAQKRSQQQYLVSNTSCTKTRPMDGDAVTTTAHATTTTTTQQNHQHSQHRRKLRKIAKMIQRKQRRLSNLINLTLVQSSHDTSVKHPSAISTTTPQSTTSSSSNTNLLRYYQGYHDVACIILSTIGISTTYARYVPPVFLPVITTTTHQQHPHVRTTPLHSDPSILLSNTITGFEMATSILYQLSQSHFRDCMRNNFSQLQIVMRLTIFPLLSYFDSEVHEHLMLSDMMEPYFALSWIITWFSHDIRDTELVKRLFDFFIVSHPLMPIYMTIAMICHPLNRQDVLQTEHDFSTVHQTLSQLPRNSSMVGWKYRPGDGYVSDDDDNSDDDRSSCDDDDMDDDLLSIGPMGSQSSVDTEFLLQEAATMKQSNSTGNGRSGNKSSMYTDSYMADAEAISIVSSSMSSMYNARVPFQELMELAIQYMERIPPKQLIVLATRYYGREYVEKELTSPHPDAPPAKGNMSIRDDITFLQTPPTWTRSFTAHSDQTLKYYRTHQRRRARSMSTEKENTSLPETTAPPPNTIEPDEVVAMYKLFQANGDTGKLMAVIAAGYGLGDDMTEIRSRKRKLLRRKRFLQAGTALAVMVVAIGIGYYLQQKPKQNPIVPQQNHPPTSTTGTDVNSTCAADSRNDPLMKLSSSKIIATSTKTSTKEHTGTPDPTIGRRTGGQIMDMIQECTFRSRQLFERKCPTSLAEPKNHNRIMQTSDQKFSNRRDGPMKSWSGNNVDRGTLQLGFRQLRTVSKVQYEKVFRKIVSAGHQIHNIGKTMLFSPMLDGAFKSKHVLVETTKVVTQKTKVIQTNAVAARLALDDLSQHISEFLQITYRDGVTRLKAGINDKKHSLAVTTSKVVNVAKSAMIEYGNDVVASSTAMEVGTTPPPIIATLRKQFEPSDLNLISAHLHTLIQNAPFKNSIAIHEITKWCNIVNSLLGKLLTLPDVSRQHFTGVADQLREMKQWKRFGKHLLGSFRIVVGKVTDKLTSPGLLDSIRGATLLDHHSLDENNRPTIDISKLQLEVDVDKLSQESIRSNGGIIGLRHTRSGEDRCLSKLELNTKKKLQFAKPANSL